MTARRPDPEKRPARAGRGGRAGVPAADAWLLLALLCFLAGAITLVVTWYKISGLALLAQQLPYLASGGLGGLALMIVGTGCLSAGRSARIEARLVELLQIATEPVGTSTTTADTTGSSGTSASDARVLTVTGGTTYHRPGCRLTAGKETSSLSLDDALRQGLSPCPVCH